MSGGGVFCGECGRLEQRGPFTVIQTDLCYPAPAASTARDTWLCRACAEVFGLVVGHNYASGECPCNGDARHHGYLNANGD